MNSWKRSLFGREGAGAGAGTGPGMGASGPRAGRLMAGLPRQVGDIVESGVESGDEEKEGRFFLPSKWAG